MGLRDKIKDALNPERDHEDSTVHGQKTSSDYATPQDAKYGATGTTGRDYQTGSYQKEGITGDRTNKHVGGGLGHRPADSGVNFGDRAYNKDAGDFNKNDKFDTNASRQDPYWGAMGQGDRTSPPGTSHTQANDDSHSRLHHKDLPLRPGEQPGATSDHLDAGSHGNRDLGTGGASYTEAGVRSREYDNRLDQPGDNTGHQNQPAGSRDLNQPRGAGYDSRIHDRDMGHDNRTGLVTGAGAGAIGAGAGLTGAGIAAGRDHDLSHRDDLSRDAGLGPASHYQTGGGAPQSSMLDPYQTGPNTGRTGPYDTGFANKMDPRVDSDRDGSHLAGSRQDHFGNSSRSGIGAAGVSNASTTGPGHYGPAHEGAKVMHRCVGCGLDNDISQYFKKDAIYRMS